nr:metal ABC transporter permease [Halomicronema sp. CCY15110]
MAAITLTIVAGIQTVGVILVVALMVTPSATTYLLVKELPWMMLIRAMEVRAIAVAPCCCNSAISACPIVPDAPVTAPLFLRGLTTYPLVFCHGETSSRIASDRNGQSAFNGSGDRTVPEM